MVILNNDLILKWNNIQKSIKLSSKKSDLKSEKAAKKLTHLYLSDRRINGIGDISQFTSVSTIYLHNNQLSSLHNIGCLLNLTHLYLQRNKIQSLSGFERLTKLQKLYLGYNEISVVEGLENQSALQLLHVEYQKLEPGGALYFDPRTLSTLQECCQDLDISHNHIGSIIDLQQLRSLKQVNIIGNDLTNLEEVCGTIQEWTNVVHLQLSGNPLCKHKKYPNQVLIASPYSLKSLDGKPVSPITKVFLQKFEEEKLKRRESAPNVSDVFSSEVKHLVKHLPEGLCRVVSGQILENTISGGGPYHPVPITFPLNNIAELQAKTELKFGLRGSKHRSKIFKTKKPTSEEENLHFTCLNQERYTVLN